MKISPQESAGGQANCYDVLYDVDAALRDAMLPEQRYFVLGGIASGALASESTVIDTAAQTVVASEDSAIPTVRPNGTRRDIDILIDTVLSEADAERIKQNVAAAIGNQLVVSVFGFDRHTGPMTRKDRWLHDAKDWISSRTIDEHGTLRYELFPLEQTVDATSYDPWRLTLPNGQHVDVLHPAGHTLAYTMRSISGIRHKDRAKFEAMSRLVLPTFEEEVWDGPFKEWATFARDIEMLRVESRVSADGRRAEARGLDTSLFRTKARTLHWLESHERVVDFAQGDAMQRVLNVFVHAK